MNIGRFSVSRPVAVSMRILALVVLGYITLLRLPVDLLPRIDIPTVVVNVTWPNTSPEEMETQITRPIEQAVSSVRGLDQVSSTSSLGSSSVRVQFKYGVNVDQAAIDVSNLVQRAQRRFPRDTTISTPSIFKFDPSQLPILTYGIVPADGDLIKLRSRLVNEISPQIESAGGVAAVNIDGGYDRAIMVDVDPDRLRAHDLNIADVTRRLSQENISLPAGVVTEGKTQYNLRSVGYFKSVDEIKQVPLGTFNGHQVTLQEVADVRDASQDVLTFTRMNGKPAVSVSVTKQSDANTVETADAVKKVMDGIAKREPDLKFAITYDQSIFIQHSITDLKETAVIGAVLAILIITFFLRNLKSTFVVALSIPISIISTFALLYFAGFTLNTISLSGLALATGLIVDDAIVVLENIYRHIERNRSGPAQAAVTGTQEIISAVLASTFTVMIVFLPLFLIQGRPGQVFTQFALVVVFSLAVSLLDATTVVPMLAARMVNKRDVIEEAHPETRTRQTPTLRMFDKVGEWQRRLDANYRRGLQWSIHHRGWVIVIGLACVAAALLMWPHLGKQQFPETDSGNLTVRLRLPIGTPVETTDASMRKIESVLLADPDVSEVFASVGSTRFGGGISPQEGNVTVRLKDGHKTSTDDVVKRLRRQLAGLPGAQAQVQTMDMVSRIMGNNTGFSVDVYGADLTQLADVARKVQTAMSDVPGLENVNVGVQDALPEVKWEVDRQKAQALGVSFSDVASVISAATSGQLATYYQENGFQYPIYVQVPRRLRSSITDIKQLPVTTGLGGAVITLGQVAKAKIGLGPNEVARQNRQRYINVGGSIQDRSENEIEADVTQALSKVDFPVGTHWELSYRQLQGQKEFANLGLAVTLAILLIYILLASQFESFVYPLVVLTSVPLCAIGLVLALFITGRDFGITAFIGLLMLMGIVVKNGILLVDYTNILRRRGMEREEAILLAGPTRLRPILMTTFAAIFGMAPLAIGLGSGSEMYVPLATAVIGGLATSTLLTLIVVPTVYTLFDDLEQKIRARATPLDWSTGEGDQEQK
ncbi:MAG TPA: efflux RND transporter permease subunit [Fimbriimonadaceae bacterium]|nr:efflux RND transporter permease subunit [Fimbriimonadaceae bacterium]